MNNITILGRATREPELRATPSGKMVATYTLAVDKVLSDAQRKYLEENGLPLANFRNVTTFGKQAENDAKYIGKGKMVCVSGSTETNDYKNSKGEKKRYDYILANKVEYIEYKNSKQEGESQLTEAEAQALEVDDDIPF